MTDSHTLKRLRETHPERRASLENLIEYTTSLQSAITALDAEVENLKAQLREKG